MTTTKNTRCHSPLIAARARASIARRVEAAQLLISGAGSTDGLAAVDTDPLESTVGSEHGWAEYVKQRYDIGDGSDE